MSKIICDVCGTRYPDTAEQCPICGCVHAGGGKTVADDIVMDEAQPTGSTNYVRGGRFSKSNVRKRNRNMPRQEIPEEKPRAKVEAKQEEEEYDFDYDAPKQKSNAVLNVLLVIVILALLCVTGYIFVQYFLPGMLAPEATEAPTEPYVETTVPPTTEPEITEEPTIPCESLEMAEEDNFIILNGEGYNHLLNVAVNPADTTDVLTYASSDESIVTVDSEGCLTAVGEGEATITITCGAIELQCDVVCLFAEPTEAPTEGPTEAPTEPLKDVKLEANYTDITLTGHGQQFTFKLTGLSNDEVTWTSDNEKCVTVENGTVTRVSKGTANITVKYGDQELVIIVRCR